MIALFSITYGVDLLKIAFFIGIGGKSGEGFYFQGILSSHPGAHALQMGDSLVAVVIVAKACLMEFPDQSGIDLELLPAVFPICNCSKNFPVLFSQPGLLFVP